MGLYDTLYCDDPRFVCSEGHGLAGEEFQTKDLDETMNDWSIANGVLSLASSGGWRDPLPSPITESLVIYCECKQCPAFVQKGTLNLVGCSVDFAVEVKENAIVSVTRTSPSTAEWLEATPRAPWMQGCSGPMPYDEANRLHCAWRQPRAAPADPH